MEFLPNGGYCLHLLSFLVSAEQQCMLGWFKIMVVMWMSCLCMKRNVHCFFSEWNILRKVKSNKTCFILHFSGFSYLLLQFYLECYLSNELWTKWLNYVFPLSPCMAAVSSVMRGAVVPDVAVSCRLKKKQHGNRIAQRITLIKWSYKKEIFFILFQIF